MTAVQRIGKLQDTIPAPRRDQARRDWLRDNLDEIRALVADEPNMRDYTIADLLGMDRGTLRDKLRA